LPQENRVLIINKDVIYFIVPSEETKDHKLKIEPRQSNFSNLAGASPHACKGVGIYNSIYEALMSLFLDWMRR